MKQFILYLLSLVLCGAAVANPGPLPVPAGASAATASKALANAGAIRFQFNKIAASVEHKDSVLIIFDRYDRTGAGVVYQIFAADSAQGITIPQIPAGKYYVTIQGLGLHRDRMEKLITIKAKKNSQVRISLSDLEEFSKENVVIPAYRPAFNDMVVLKSNK
jgi:hypothetical protein